MIISDKLYGVVDIQDKVLIELLKSDSLTRLKSISQYGIPDKYYHLRNFSRFEHSAGVMLFLRKINASLEEQIAGLLHDVSHLAFSHLADWVFGKGESGIEDHQDEIYLNFLLKTEIPQILAKHKLDFSFITNQNNFPLLEKKIPDLCADRIDYSLREMYYWFDKSLPPKIIPVLTVFQNKIVFKSQQSALLFAESFLELQNKHWGGYETMMRYFLFAKAIKRALSIGIIEKKEFYLAEELIIRKIESSKDKSIREILLLLSGKKLSLPKNKYHRKIVKKFRYVDPFVQIGKNLKRLSELVPDFGKKIDKYFLKNKKGFTV